MASLLQDLLADMNELKESNEILKQTTDDLKQQQNEFKNLLDLLNKEKENWVGVYELFFHLSIDLFEFRRRTKPILKISKKNYVIYKISWYE